MSLNVTFSVFGRSQPIQGPYLSTGNFSGHEIFAAFAVELVLQKYVLFPK